VVAANESPVITTCGSLHSYKKPDGSAFVLNGHYIGTQQSGPTVLNYDGHAGIDYRVPYGTDVFAAADGQVVVVDSSNSTSAGNYIRIQHGDFGYQSQYLHLSEILVTQGQQVTRGDLIGRSGNTAGPTGNVSPHLHFEAKRLSGGTWVSVYPYGWRGSRVDPYTAAVNVNLWKSQTPILTVSTISPPEQPASSGTLSISISNTGVGTMNYTATVTSGSSWLTILSGGSGVNSGALVLSFAANDDAERFGSVLLTAPGATGSPVTITIRQGGMIVTAPDLIAESFVIDPTSGFTRIDCER